MFNNILVATDFSPSSRAALFAAVHLGARSLSRIHAVHVITFLEDIFRASRYPIPDTKWRKAIQKRLNDFFPESLYPNSRRHTILAGSISDEILNYARSHKCGLIVTGTHGRSALGRLLLGSVTSRLVRASQVPVMVVREAEKSAERYQGFDRILVPTDFSDTSIRALDFAVQFAKFLESEIHLLHVVDLPAISAFQSTYHLPDVTLPDTCELNVDLTLRKMLEKHEMLSEPKVRTSIGDPAKEILRYADELNCNFIVMGTHGRKGLERTLLGSVTTTVLANATIPVFTISTAENVYTNKVVQGTVTEIGRERIQQL